MGHGLAGVGAVVDHDPEARSEPQLLGHLAGDDEQVAEDGLVRAADASPGAGSPSLGMISRWTGAWGWMSWITMQRSSSCSIFAGISRSMILWKRVLAHLGSVLRQMPGRRHKNRSVRSAPAGGARGGEFAQEAEQVVVFRRLRGVSRLSGGSTAGRRFVIRSVDSRKGASCFSPAMTSARAKSCVPEWSVRAASQWKKPWRGSLEWSFSSRRAAAALKASAYVSASSGAPGRLRLELGEAERDRRLDLLREEQVLPGHVGEERVDEMQATQLVADPSSFLRFSRALISLMNSETSRNSL